MDIEPIIRELLQSMGYSVEVAAADVGGQTAYSIRGLPEPRDLIGMHGDSLHAIDTLVKKIAEKRAGGEDLPLFLVDIDEYRARQIRDLQNKARMMAERARSFQYDVELSPMSAYERLIVHTVLANEPHVKTESQGEGRNRRVVIKYTADS